MTLTVAIIGRPNVGKSTLFNQLAGRRLALVHDTPGVTRDRREGIGRIADLEFRLFDTAGLDEAAGETLEARMRDQTERAVAEADVAVLLIDSREGITSLDRHFAQWLRKRPTPIILVANKCEGRAGEQGFYESYALGMGEPLAISAKQGEGMAGLYEALDEFATHVGKHADAHPPTGIEAEDDDHVSNGGRPLRLAIVGRPNVGKSTLVNRMIGEERMLTGPEPGITRDAVSVDWTYDGRAVQLFDTAGMRRRARIADKLERLSVEDAERAVRFAEVVVLVLDAGFMLEKQDLTIARMTGEQGRALVIAVNKWDMVADREGALSRLRDRLEASLPQVKGVSYVTLSALTGKGVDRLMAAVFRAHELWAGRLATAELNRWLAKTVAHHPPPLARGREVKARYITQVSSRPPTFAIFANRPAALSESYLRYLANALRADFGLPGIPIRLRPRRTRNPYIGE